MESCGEVGVLEGGGREALEAELREVESLQGEGAVDDERSAEGRGVST